MSSSYFARTTDNLTYALAKLSQLEVTLLNLRRNEKDFLLRKDEKYLAKFKDNADKFRNQQNELAFLCRINLPKNSMPTSKRLLNWLMGTPFLALTCHKG
ncbi:hypothetical protein VTH8203_03332 [Vibrio thalassae]|uniref:Uncharacterized protein n=1 Tax=Vibrio thalassae TaxID=1243014 RepID=A0A240EM32_9VIBR|nr:hypothetical protein VTH8203_03332 [Vibrio thalassae]